MCSSSCWGYKFAWFVQACWGILCAAASGVQEWHLRNNALFVPLLWISQLLFGLSGNGLKRAAKLEKAGKGWCRGRGADTA